MLFGCIQMPLLQNISQSADGFDDTRTCKETFEFEQQSNGLASQGQITGCEIRGW